MKQFENYFYTTTNRIYDDKKDLRMIENLIINDDEDFVKLVSIDYKKAPYPSLELRIYGWPLPMDFWNRSDDDIINYFRGGWSNDFNIDKLAFLDFSDTTDENFRNQLLAEMNAYDRKTLEHLITLFENDKCLLKYGAALEALS